MGQSAKRADEVQSLGRMMQVVALLLVGARPEPYLAALLASLNGAIDRLVVNDNSGLPGGLNRRVIETSQLFHEGRVDIVEAPFEGFARARNLCLDAIRAADNPDPLTWVLMVDADEVHGPLLANLTRRVLPSLAPAVSAVDGYVVQFMQTNDFFISLDRRHNLLYKLNPDLHYEREVHERLKGISGRDICLPYTYYHYGYVRPNQQILEKWVQYNRLGDTTYDAQSFPDQASPSMFLDQAPICMPFRWRQPPALKILDITQLANPETTLEFRHVVESHLLQPWPRCRAWLRRVNYRIRLLFRLLEATLWLRNPFCWAELVRMVISV